MKKEEIISHRIITSEETYAVRHPVLRPNKPISLCVFTGDDLHTTIHIGGYLDNKLIAVVSLFHTKNIATSKETSYQLRGMAILDKYQGKGVGKKILALGETILRNKNVSSIWMNARENAISFYINSGYSKIGCIFDIPNIGPHIVMCKKLN